MDEVRFVADVMVGKLARWLRVLGFDVAYSNTFTDDDLDRISQLDKRVILTRDLRFAASRKASECVIIESDHYREQVQQVIQTFGLKEFRTFSRCLECNALLRQVDKEEVFEKVPPYVYLTQERFATCPMCRRVYWRGTHADEMLKRMPIPNL